MKNRSLGRRLTSLLLAIALLLTLCGCGGRNPDPEDAPSADGTIVESVPKATVSKEDEDKYMHNDPTILSHMAHNKELDPTPPADRRADEFHIYVANTETMQGFVNAQRVTAYQDGIKSAFDAAYDMYQNLYSHSMIRQGSTGLYWGETEEVDDLFTRDVLSPLFYEGNVLPMDGALAPLFRKGATPFQENALTLIVSNFVEPGFDLNSVSVGIEKYFDSYTRSAACVIGFTSYFEGKFHIPQYSSAKDKSTFYLYNFKGEVPYYMVVVGPQSDVKEYTEKLFKYLDTCEVDYGYEHFSNSVYEEVFAEPLVFDAIPDVKAKKLPLDTPFSYNTGTMTEHAEGNAFFTTYSSVETRDGASDSDTGRGKSKDKDAESGEDVTKVSASTQISLISRNYDGVSVFDHEYTLYVYDQDTKTWKDAGKNAIQKMNVEVRPQAGPLEKTVVDKTYVILSDNREEMYVSVRLDFGTEDILNRDEIYRLEMKLHLNQQTQGTGTANGSGLSDRSITSTAYYAIRDELIAGDNNGNYVWSAMLQAPREKAARVFAKTPNLDALLISLEQLEGKYKTHTEMYSYLDFVFNIKDGKGSRSRR